VQEQLGSTVAHGCGAMVAMLLEATCDSEGFQRGKPSSRGYILDIGTNVESLKQFYN